MSFALVDAHGYTLSIIKQCQSLVSNKIDLYKQNDKKHDGNFSNLPRESMLSSPTATTTHLQGQIPDKNNKKPNKK